MNSNAKLNYGRGLSKLPKHVVKDGAKWLMVPSKIILDGLSMWPERQNSVTWALNLLCIVSYFLLFWGHYCYIAEGTADLGSMTYALSITSIAIESITRRVLILFYKSRLNRMLSKLYFELWPSNMVGETLSHELLKSSRFLFYWWATNTFLAFVCGMQYFMVPIFNDTLPLKTAYWFWQTSPYYGLLYIWQSFMSLELVFNILGTDLFFVSLLSNCVAQFRLLRAFIRDRFLKVALRVGLGQNRSEAMKMMVVCIERHNKLIRFCKEIDHMFTFFILVQFLCSMGTVCLSAFSVTSVPEQIGTSSTYLMGHICQLLIYSYMGNELIMESTALSDTIFQCGWDVCNFDKELQKAMVLMMVRAQKPIRLSAGGFGYLSLQSFIKVLQFSFSVFTLLNSIMAKLKEKN